MRAKLPEIKKELRKRMHQPLPEQGRWLAQVVRGYLAYHAVPTNRATVTAFHRYVVRLWHRTLRRRSQKGRFTWERMERLAGDWLPSTSKLPPLAKCAICRQTLEVKTGCPNWARCIPGGGTYSITAAARASSVGGMAIPSTFAVFTLMTSSYSRDQRRTRPQPPCVSCSSKADVIRATMTSDTFFPPIPPELLISYPVTPK